MIIPSVSSEVNFNQNKINKSISKNFNKISPTFYKLISEWFIAAFSNFNDIEKYIILIYLIRNDFIFYRRNGIIIDYDTFYKDKILEIPKINLTDISKDLDIPKESVRRKIVSLENSGVLKKSGKKIIIDRSAYETVQPIKTLTNVSNLLSIFSEILHKEKIINSKYSNQQLTSVIKKNFSFCWYQFYKFLFRYIEIVKKQYPDLEAFCIGMVIMLNAASHKDFKDKDISLKKWRDEISDADKVGLNTMSISDISKIPRSTVVRKLKILMKLNVLEINDKKLYKIKFSEKALKDGTKIQNEVLKALSNFVVRIYNQSNLR
tara:strand:- start:5882 stop:6841 length:960 start_codon:yes stop_codon:yes gene_type:complete